jgi:hypothetical protein
MLPLSRNTKAKRKFILNSSSNTEVLGTIGLFLKVYCMQNCKIIVADILFYVMLSSCFN